MPNPLSLHIHFSEEVERAQAHDTPIVALESTIISHGMPYPQNLDMVREVEAIIRDEGATPATIAVIDGIARVGLDHGALEDFAGRDAIAKLSRADLADCIARGGTGATTVAATMILARLAHIDVFATGGIGGAHRGAESSFDISADLRELAKTDVIVVSAGAKAILDLPKTFEIIETLGVPVYAYQSDEIPAFYSRSSSIPAPLRADNPSEIAAGLRSRRALGLEGGILVANPIPQKAEIPAHEIAPVIEAALTRAATEKIRAKDVTPFLLDAIFHATSGRSLAANIELVKANARLGAKIALAMAKK